MPKKFNFVIFLLINTLVILFFVPAFSYAMSREILKDHMAYWLWADSWEGTILNEKWAETANRTACSKLSERTSTWVHSVISFDRRQKEEDSIWWFPSQTQATADYHWNQRFEGGGQQFSRKEVVTEGELKQFFESMPEAIPEEFRDDFVRGVDDILDSTLEGVPQSGYTRESKELRGQWRGGKDSLFLCPNNTQFGIIPHPNKHILLVDAPRKSVEGKFSRIVVKDGLLGVLGFLGDGENSGEAFRQVSHNIRDSVVLLPFTAVSEILPEPFSIIKGEYDRLGGPKRNIIDSSYLRRSQKNDNVDIIAWELWPVHDFAAWRQQYRAMLEAERSSWLEKWRKIQEEHKTGIVARAARAILDRHEMWIEQLLADADRVLPLLLHGEVPGFFLEMHLYDSRVENSRIADRIFDGPAETIDHIHKHLWSYIPDYPPGSIFIIWDRLPPCLKRIYTSKQLENVMFMEGVK
jgi:hypothetical protein